MPVCRSRLDRQRWRDLRRRTERFRAELSWQRPPSQCRHQWRPIPPIQIPADPVHIAVVISHPATPSNARSHEAIPGIVVDCVSLLMFRLRLGECFDLLHGERVVLLRSPRTARSGPQIAAPQQTDSAPIGSQPRHSVVQNPTIRCPSTPHHSSSSADCPDMGVPWQELSPYVVRIGSRGDRTSL